jgi:hypothetical protein
MSQPLLRLVWVNEAILAQRNRDKPAKSTIQDANPPPAQQPHWFTLIAPGIAFLLATIAGAFFFGTLNTKTDFGERVARVESRLDVFESAVRKQLIAKAQELLGTSNVQVALINQRSDIIFPFSEKRPLPVTGAKGQKEWFVDYEIEGIKNKSVILRAKIEEEVGGKITRTVYDRRIQIKLPIEEKRVTYDFMFEEDKVGFSTPPVRLEIVILEQIGTETLVVALGLSLTPEKKQT